MMPNKTIYVSDGDLPIFERAQELAGENLSATIAGALRRYVENAEARAKGLEEIIVKVGKVAITRKRFWGKLLAKGHVADDAAKKQLWYKIYQTAKGAFAVSITSHPKWWYSDGSDWKNWDWDWDRQSANWGEWWKAWKQDHPQAKPRSDEYTMKEYPKMKDWQDWSEQAEHRLEIYASLEEVGEHVPEELYQATRQALRDDPIEDLDI
ncbi:EXLDI protein [Acididesulfobacillus acetoxydans]|nr:EXLDI protein [Acididesulfobacillus acetoxydans]